MPITSVTKHFWYKILSMTTSGFCAMHVFSCTKTNRGKSTVSVHVLQIHLLQIHVLQIHVLQIHVLQIYLLQIHVLQIQSMFFYKSNPVHVLQHANFTNIQCRTNSSPGFLYFLYGVNCMPARTISLC